ncbi:MAG: peptidoglycan DD-metalloendopeptidase family protein [Methylobacter sp.]
MKISPLIIVLLAAFPLTANAKKLYKFQDEQGVWHFTDKRPDTDKKVEIRQIKAAPKQVVSLLQAGDKQHPQFYIRNDYPGPVEVEINFSDRDNVKASPELPRRFVVEPGTSPTLFEANAVDGQKGWKLALKYRYMIGAPQPNYNAIASYLPPIAPDAAFQISQAFGGSFSHTDAQNHYAVDIVMPVGTPIYAAKAGVVVETENDFYKGGDNKAYSSEANNIRILHDDGAMSVYAHLELETAQVYPGMTVAAGQLIGHSGNTGFTTGPHLHFAVQVNRGMELVSVPFNFINQSGQAEQPAHHAWLKGLAATQVMGSTGK